MNGFLFSEVLKGGYPELIGGHGPNAGISMDVKTE